MKRSDDKGWLKDGSLSFEGGADAGRQPHQIDRNQCEKLINTTVRGGNATPRPGWKKRPLTFSSQTVQDGFEQGFFHTGSPYTGNGNPALISSQNGRVFKLDVTNFTVTEITPTASFTVNTTADFVIPAVSGTVAVAINSSARITTQFDSITIGGYVFKLDSVDSGAQITVTNMEPGNVGITVFSPATVSFTGFDINDPTQLLNWSIQADQFWILQNNRALPIIYDGAKAVRSNPAKKQVPTGNVMCYAAARLSVALTDRTSYRVGDILFGASGTALYNGRDAILYYTENDFLNEGGDLVARIFGAPSDSGPILDMKAVSQSDTSLGQGPMLVGTPNVVFTVSLPFDRTIWKNMANALQTSTPIIGPVGTSTVLVNTDLWYRSLDGIRSYILAQRQFNGSPGNTPQSTEVNYLLEADTKDWLEFGSCVLFDNRLLMTVSPQMTPHGVYHRGLVVLDFNLDSGLKKKFGAAWEGLWTGLRILKIMTVKVNNVDRAFMYVLNDSCKIELWELTTGDEFDDGTNRVRIKWRLDLPSYNGGDSDRFKTIETARLLISDIVGTVSFSVYYRSDERWCWNPWYEFERCQESQDCGPFLNCRNPFTFVPHPRRPIRLPQPPDDSDPVNQVLWRACYEAQPSLRIEGYCELKQFRIFFRETGEILGLDRQDET